MRLVVPSSMKIPVFLPSTHSVAVAPSSICGCQAINASFVPGTVSGVATIESFASVVLAGMLMVALVCVPGCIVCEPITTGTVPMFFTYIEAVCVSLGLSGVTVV